ncbi:hypothetical protein FHG87_011564 [Trinorchestia longiramus]|nr:hypothetical protein FHG87_011564 [Trinorchestia longiramus]
MNVLVAAVVVSLAITTVTSEAIRNFSLHEADIPTLTEREASSDNPSIIASVLNDGDSYGEPPLTLDASPPPEESSDVEEHSRTYDVLYQQGIDHYLSDDWHQCVSYIQLAIKDHRWYRDTLVSCRRDCRAEALSSTPLAVHRNNAQEFYETTIKNALCLLKCRQKYFSGRHQHVAALNVDRDFAIRKPYDYLQLCLFKTGRVQDAANAAVTVLAVQPTHTVMTNNLRQYIEDYDADKDLLENLELQEYAREYVRGDHAHSAEDFTRSVEHMEAALALYWRALEDCRLMCEEPFDQGWFPDFVSSRKCGAQLSNLYGEEIENFLPSMLNYLQYGYQKLDQIPKACSAVESYLELLPADASMLRNKQYYLSNYQKVDRHFVVRKEIAEHAAKERYEELSYLISIKHHLHELKHPPRNPHLLTSLPGPRKRGHSPLQVHQRHSGLLAVLCVQWRRPQRQGGALILLPPPLDPTLPTPLDPCRVWEGGGERVQSSSWPKRVFLGNKTNLLFST